MSKYHNLIQQDFRMEHIILYMTHSDIEYNKLINDTFQGFDTVRKKYIKSSNSNRASNIDRYKQILSIKNISKKDFDFIKLKEKNYKKLTQKLKDIVNKYNISNCPIYYSKISFNTRKNGYLKLFINALFKYYNTNDNIYEMNLDNTFFLLKKFIKEFKTFDNLVYLYKKDNYENEKSETVLIKSRSCFNYIKEFIDNNDI